VVRDGRFVEDVETEGVTGVVVVEGVVGALGGGCQGV